MLPSLPSLTSHVSAICCGLAVRLSAVSTMKRAFGLILMTRGTSGPLFQSWLKITCRFCYLKYTDWGTLLINGFRWGQMVHGAIKVPVWLHRLPCVPCAPVALFSSSHLNYILKVISYAFSPVQSTSVACGCWFVTCLAWGSASLGHSHSPELRPTGKLINTQAPYKGLVLSSMAQPHICLCLGPRSPLHPHTPGKNYSKHVWRNTLPRVTQAGNTGKTQALIWRQNSRVE